MLISSKVNKGELMFWRGGRLGGGLGVYDKLLSPRTKGQLAGLDLLDMKNKLASKNTAMETQ